MSGEPSGGGSGSGTLTVNPFPTNASTTTSAPAPESAITTELLLAIIVPVALILLFCSIGCLRYCRKGKDEQISHDEELVKRGMQPADGIILPPSSKHYVTRLGRGFNDDDDPDDGGEDEEEESEYSSDDQNNNGRYRNDYNPGAAYGLDGFDDEPSKPPKKKGKLEARSTTSATGVIAPPSRNKNSSSSSARQSGAAAAAASSSSGKWQGLRRFNPDQIASADENTSDLNSQTSVSRLPPAPGEAAILNPFGRANAHARNTTPSKRQLYEEKQKQQRQQQIQQQQVLSSSNGNDSHVDGYVPAVVRSMMTPSQQPMQPAPKNYSNINNNQTNSRSPSADRRTGRKIGTTLSDLGDL